jgi:hypothetical protein
LEAKERELSTAIEEAGLSKQHVDAMPGACLWCKKRLVGSRYRIHGTPYSICPEHVGALPSEASSLLYNIERACLSPPVALHCAARPHLA